MIRNKILQVLPADESLQNHIEILGIDFRVDEWIPVTDDLRKILQSEAKRNIQRPVLAAACDGKVTYSIASSEAIQKIPPERRKKVVISGIETELLAASYDDTPIPVLTQKHIEQAAKEVWLHPARVALAVDEFPGPSDIDDLVILFPNVCSKWHQVKPARSLLGDENGLDGKLDRNDFPF